MAPPLISMLTVIFSAAIITPGSGHIIGPGTKGYPQTHVSATYDYIVIGSGPGGGPLAANLARAGHSVLLMEAGDDQSENPLSAIPQLFPQGHVDPAMRWDFFVRHYDDDDERTLRHRQLVWELPDGQFWVGRGFDAPENATMLGIYYPRGGTLGGSSAVNAMGSVLPSDSDWQHIADMTGDSSWSPENMRKIFETIERNHYLAPGTAGHGFDGWLHTNQGNASGYEPYTNQLSVLKQIAASLGQNPDDILEHLAADINQLDPNRDQTEGVYNSALHVSAQWRRFSSRDYVLETANAANPDGSKEFPLYLGLNTLATKILFDQPADTESPGAYGVQYLNGPSVYSADPRHDPATSPGVEAAIQVAKEIIVSAGALNTPQLLKLSGVGPAEELRAFDIDVVVDLPGIGDNLQENYEMPIVAAFNDTFTLPPDPDGPACTFGIPDDPCVELWRRGEGPYMSFGNLNGGFRKTAGAALGERDHFFTVGPFAIRGFRPPAANTQESDPPNTFALSTVKMHPSSARAGTVRLRSANPQDTPLINFHYFHHDDGTESADLDAILDTVKWARRTFASVGAPLAPAILVEPPCVSSVSGAELRPDADGRCDDAADSAWITEQSFGHHAASSAAIGADDDPKAVLDGDFRVRGVRGLRVVDASAFPRIPGAFPALATFMLSQKASVAILEGASG